MSLDNNQLQFLWHLFCLYFLGKKDEALRLMELIYERCPNLPESIESLLLEFWKTGADSALIDAVVFSVRQFYFDPERQAVLVSALFDRKLLSVNEAVQLVTIRGIASDNLPDSIQRLFDAVWLINEDLLDHVMSPEQDSLFKNSLADVWSDRRKVLENTGP